MNDNDDTVLDFGSEYEPKSKKNVIHPVTCFFHLAFRISAILVYVVCGKSAGFVLAFIIVLLLLSADFWVVKNISGRLLVGLRWWNKVSESGESSWVYESRKPAALKRHPVLRSESMIFWLGLVLSPAVWFLLIFTSLLTFSFQWLAIIIVALILNGANLFGYVRCKFKSRQQIGSIATKFIGSQIFKSMQKTDEPEQSTTNSAAAM